MIIIKKLSFSIELGLCIRKHGIMGDIHSSLSGSDKYLF
jgi:hypothetical protein